MFSINLTRQKIKISSIILISNALRKHVPDAETVKNMAGSIKKIGLQSPFAVAPMFDVGTGEWKYRLADGARRFAGLQMLLKNGEIEDEVEVGILPENTSDVDLLALQVCGNIEKLDTQDADFIRALHSILTEKNWDYTEASENLGIPKSRIIDLFQTLTLPQEVQEKITSKEIGLPQAIALSKFYNRLPEEMKTMAVEYAENESATNLMVKLNELKEQATKVAGSNKKSLEIVFTPLPRFIGKAKVEAMYEEAVSSFNTEEKLSEYDQGAYDAVCKIFEMDPESIEIKRTQFDLDLASARAKKDKKDINKLKTAESLIKDRGFKVFDSNGQPVDLLAAIKEQEYLAKIEGIEKKIAEASDISDDSEVERLNVILEEARNNK